MHAWAQTAVLLTRDLDRPRACSIRSRSISELDLRTRPRAAFELDMTAHDDIATLLDQVSTGMDNNPAIVGIVDKVLASLLANGLAIHIVLPPASVGVHPKNRYGAGLIVSNVHKLGASFKTLGFSMSQTSDAVCVEDGDDGEIAAFTTKLQASSPYLGKSAQHEIIAGAIACTHTNQFLLAARQTVKTNVPRLANSDGNIDYGAIVAKDSVFKTAAEVGIKWIMINRKAVVLYPILPELIQKARQVVGQVQNRETQLELLMSIVEIAAQSADPIDWNAVARKAALSQSPYATDIMGLIEFLKNYGGGRDAKFVHRLNTFVSLKVPADRHVPNKFLEALNKLASTRAPKVCLIHAYVKSNLAAPDDFARASLCTLFSASDLSVCNDPKHIEIEHMLKEVWAFEGSLTTEEVVDIICQFEIEVPRILNGKPCAAFKTVKAAAHACYLKLDATGKMPTNFVVKYADHDRDEKADKQVKAETTSKRQADFVEYDTAGNSLNSQKLHLARKGFEVDAIVKNPSDKKFAIVDITEDSVHLREQEQSGQLGVSIINSKIEIFLQKYTVCAAAVKKEIVPWPANCLALNANFNRFVITSKVLVGLHMFCQEFPEPSSVEVRLKPTRCIVATDTFKSKSIILAPCTHKVDDIILDPKKTPSKWIIDIGQQEKKNLIIVLSPPIMYGDEKKTVKLYTMAFMVGDDEDGEPGNCELVYKKLDESKSHLGFHMKIPVIQNRIQLVKGDVLLLPGAAKKVKKPKTRE